MKKRTIIYTVFFLIVFLCLGALLFYKWMQKPLYVFGSVRMEKGLRAPLKPPRQTDARSFKVESDIQLYVQSYGTGTPVLVVHGGPGIPYTQLWKGLRPLQNKFKFYFYHQRGSGYSSRPIQNIHSKNYYSNMKMLDRTLGLGAQIADIERIRRILGVKKLILIGHSFGGFLASIYASEFPKRVERLILVAPADVIAPKTDENNFFTQARKKLPQKLHKKYDALCSRYFDFGSIFSRSDNYLARLHEEIGFYLLRAMGYPPTKPTSKQKRKRVWSGGWSVFALYFSMGRSMDFRPILKNITAPTLILHGKDDHLALQGSLAYKKAIKHAKWGLIHRAKGQSYAGHFIYDENPEAFHQYIRSFLQ